LVSNRNLLLVADVLVVNKGFADKNPKMVAGLVDGLLRGNQAVRDNPEANADVVAKAFKCNRAKALDEFKKVSLANLPEQMAFFNGAITQGGSFANIFESSIQAYAPDFKDLINYPVNSTKLLSLDALKAEDASGEFKSQVAAIKPLESTARVAEVDPVLSKDIRFEFKAMSHDLDMANKTNLDNLDAIKRILDISPGSRILLVGHVDPSAMEQIRKDNGDEGVRQAALAAKQLSKERAAEVLAQLVKHNAIDTSRVDSNGMGWDKPISKTDGAKNRRVEVQWFTLE